MDIKELQKEAWAIIQGYNKKHGLRHNKETVFYHLIEEIGELTRELYHYKNPWRKKFNKQRFSEELVDVVAQLLILAKDFDVDIEKVFKSKIKKLKKRFDLK